jgi:hypothetical protein
MPPMLFDGQAPENQMFTDWNLLKQLFTPNNRRNPFEQFVQFILIFRFLAIAHILGALLLLAFFFFVCICGAIWVIIIIK